jgi:hypothetical protein
MMHGRRVVLRQPQPVLLYSVPHFGHGGDYYRKQFPADLRVSGIGRCQPNGPRTASRFVATWW